MAAQITIDEPIEYEALSIDHRYLISYNVAQPSDGSQLTIPVLIQVGRTHRPRLVCVAGVHGDEYEGITAALELWDELKTKDLRGTLVLIPVANPPAFRFGLRRNPEDNLDMNRVFPGVRDGLITEQLAYHLFHSIVSGADLVLSMHGWEFDALVIPYVEFPAQSPVFERSRAAAHAFGLPYVEAFTWPPGLLGEVCNQAGIPAIEPEIGGLAISKPEERDLYKRGVMNLLIHLAMVPGKLDVPALVQSVRRKSLRAPAGGVLHRSVELGDQVQAGDPVATITDLWGQPLSKMVTPVDGFVALLRLRAVVSPGELVAVIFTPQDP